MKKYIILSLFALSLPLVSNASELSCPEGQKVGSVLITPAIIGTPAVTHTVHHEAITHDVVVVDVVAYDEVIIDVPGILAYDEYVQVLHNHGNYDRHGGPGNYSYVYVGNNHGDYVKIHHEAVPAVTHTVHHEAVTHTETIIDTPAYDEVIIDVPEVIAVPAVYGEACVPDESYVPPVKTSISSTPSGHAGGASSRRRLFNLTGIMIDDPKLGVYVTELVDKIIKSRIEEMNKK